MLVATKPKKFPWREWYCYGLCIPDLASLCYSRFFSLLLCFSIFVFVFFKKIQLPRRIIFLKAGMAIPADVRLINRGGACIHQWNSIGYPPPFAEFQLTTRGGYPMGGILRKMSGLEWYHKAATPSPPRSSGGGVRGRSPPEILEVSRPTKGRFPFSILHFGN